MTSPMVNVTATLFQKMPRCQSKSFRSVNFYFYSPLQLFRSDINPFRQKRSLRHPISARARILQARTTPALYASVYPVVGSVPRPSPTPGRTQFTLTCHDLIVTSLQQ